VAKVGIVKIRQTTRPSIVSQNYSAKIDISELSGVNLEGIKEGDILVYSASTGNFEVSDVQVDTYARKQANASFDRANSITVANLKALVANSATYNDFKTAIAAL
jgi:hypothetical protein